MAVLGTWCPDDAVLGTVAPLALAASAGTALVIDLDPASVDYRAAGTLAALVRDGPTGRHLRPERRGVAVLGNGGVTAEEAADVIAALAAGWPRVVLRHERRSRPTGPGVVPVHPLAPGRPFDAGPAVYQPGPWSIRAPSPGLRAAPCPAGRRPEPARRAASRHVTLAPGVAQGVGAAMAVIDRLVARVLDGDVPLERGAVEREVRRMLPDEAPLAPPGVAVEVADTLVGLGPLEPLLADPSVSDILVNADGSVWVERAGSLQLAPVRFAGPGPVVAAVQRVIAPLGLRLDRASPAVDARLSDGSRLHAMIPPASVDGPVLAIRRFTAAVADLDGLVAAGAADREAVDLLRVGGCRTAQPARLRRHRLRQDDPAQHPRRRHTRRRPGGGHRGLGRAAADRPHGASRGAVRRTPKGQARSPCAPWCATP